MGKRLQSMDVTIAGVTRSYRYDPAVAVESDDEGEASLELLRDAETTEVVLVDSSIASARVEVSYTYTVTGSVTVDLDSLESEDADDLQMEVEQGDHYEVSDAIQQDIAENIDDMYLSIDGVEVEAAFDEDGEEIEL